MLNAGEQYLLRIAYSAISDQLISLLKVFKNLNRFVFVSSLSQNNNFECVIIGSGFGGTIAAIALSNLFVGSDKKVCILERGKWWISHEIPSRPRETIPDMGKRNMREYLERGKVVALTTPLI